MGKKIRISTSLLSADFARLGEEVAALVAAGADWLHWDCMDGHFTKPLTHGPIVLKALRPHTDHYFDAHLMISNPEQQIPLFVAAGASGISIHIEATPEPVRLLEMIRNHGCKSCLTLNPDTPLKRMPDLLPHCDVVMLMGVEPGYSGQEYEDRTTERIRRLRDMIDGNHWPTLIEVDGGIHHQTARAAIGAGADVLVTASHVYHHPHGYKAAIDELHQIAAEVSPRPDIA